MVTIRTIVGGKATQQMSDEELMRQVQDGRQESLGILFDRYQPRLVAFLTRFLGDNTLAEDIAQDAFWDLWQARHAYNPSRPLKVWLYVLAKNAARSEKARAYQKDTTGEAATETIESQASAAPPLEGQSTLRLLVQDALQQLPTTQRLQIILHVYEGFSYGEIANLTQSNEIAVRVSTHRARAALKKILAPSFADEKFNEHTKTTRHS
jgi:RNA polymerase sigma factor (sigma-70 family)